MVNTESIISFELTEDNIQCKCTNIVHFFAATLFVNNCDYLTKLWMQYVEGSKCGVKEMLESLTRPVWFSPIRFSIHNDFIHFFSESVCTRIRIKEIPENIIPIINFMKRVPMRFFSKITTQSCDDTNKHYSGFYFDCILEQYFDRMRTFITVCIFLLFISKDENYALAKVLVSSTIETYAREDLDKLPSQYKLIAKEDKRVAEIKKRYEKMNLAQKILSLPWCKIMEYVCTNNIYTEKQKVMLHEWIRDRLQG